MEKKMYLAQSFLQREEQGVNVWLPRWVPRLVVEKTGKATRGLSSTGSGGGRPLTPADP